MKDVKEYSVKWTHWDSNRECLKFGKVGKVQHELLPIIINTSYQENALAAIHIKIHHTSYQILKAKPVLTPVGINFVTLLRVC